MIRPAEPRDAPAIYRIVQEVHSKTPYAHIPLCEEKIKRGIAMMIGSPSQFAWVSDHGEVCGVLLGAVDEILWSRKKEAHDVCFYVNEKGRGDGARLARKFLEWADTRKVMIAGLSESAGICPDRVHTLYRGLGLNHPVTSFLRINHE